MNIKAKQYYLLFEGELSDAPGRNESWKDFVRYRGDNRWDLITEGTDFSGTAGIEPIKQAMGTAALVNWVLQRDEEIEGSRGKGSEDLEDSEIVNDKRHLGPFAARLREIATGLNATFCVACLDGWLAGTWPPTKKEPAVRILEVKGVTKRGIWIGRYDAVFDVDTNLGPAYLYPPSADRSAKLVFQSEYSSSAGRVVLIPKSLIPKIEALKAAVELLGTKKIPPVSLG